MDNKVIPLHTAYRPHHLTCPQCLLWDKTYPWAAHIPQCKCDKPVQTTIGDIRSNPVMEALWKQMLHEHGLCLPEDAHLYENVK